MGQFLLDAGNADVNPALLTWIQTAAQTSPFDVRLQSGYREGDPRYHGKKMAIDVQLIDPKTGKVIPNYQNADSFAAYQQFANTVRGAQMQANPELGQQLRWGGYFSGPKGNYGSMDLMHFDVGGDTTPMGGGGWDTGLTPEQAKLWGLQPGGGATTATPPLADTMADAILPPPEDDFTKRQLTAGLARGIGDSSGQTRKMPITADPTGPAPALTLQSQRATFAPPEAARALAAAAPALAELFQVKEIGGAAARQARRIV